MNNNNSRVITIDYKQFDSEWGDLLLNKLSKMRSSGCFLTSLANIFYSANKNIPGTNESVTPKNLLEYTNNKRYYSKEDILLSDKLCEDFGFTINKITFKEGSNRINIITSQLSNGYVIGQTEGSSHFINITDVDSNGNLTVVDPGYSNKKYNVKQLNNIRVVS